MVRAIVRDHFEGDRAAHMMSSLTTVFAVGPLLAPIIGGALLVRYGWPSIFLFIAFWSLVLLVVAWALLAESLREPDHQALQPARILANYRTFFTTRAAVGYAGLNGLCSLGMFAFLSGSPFVLIEIYGVAPDHYGYYFGLSALTLMLGASTNKRLLRRMTGERVMRYGSLILIIGGAAAVAVPFSPFNGADGRDHDLCLRPDAGAAKRCRRCAHATAAHGRHRFGTHGHDADAIRRAWRLRGERAL